MRVLPRLGRTRSPHFDEWFDTTDEWIEDEKDFFNSPTVRWERWGRCDVLSPPPHPSQPLPLGVIHLVGGAVLGTTPRLSYDGLSQLLAQQGFLVIATPLTVNPPSYSDSLGKGDPSEQRRRWEEERRRRREDGSFGPERGEDYGEQHGLLLGSPLVRFWDHRSFAKNCVLDLKLAWELGVEARYGHAVARKLKLFSLGHSLGAKLHLLASSDSSLRALRGSAPAPAATVLLAYNNFGSAQSVPLLRELREAYRGVGLWAKDATDGDFGFSEREARAARARDFVAWEEGAAALEEEGDRQVGQHVRARGPGKTDGSVRGESRKSPPPPEQRRDAPRLRAQKRANPGDVDRIPLQTTKRRGREHHHGESDDEFRSYFEEHAEAREQAVQDEREDEEREGGESFHSPSHGAPRPPFARVRPGVGAGGEAPQRQRRRKESSVYEEEDDDEFVRAARELTEDMERLARGAGRALHGATGLVGEAAAEAAQAARRSDSEALRAGAQVVDAVWSDVRDVVAGSLDLEDVHAAERAARRQRQWEEEEEEEEEEYMYRDERWWFADGGGAREDEWFEEDFEDGRFAAPPPSFGAVTGRIRRAAKRATKSVARTVARGVGSALAVEFSPSPAELEAVVVRGYAGGDTLVVQFRSDRLDQSARLVKLLEARRNSKHARPSSVPPQDDEEFEEDFQKETSSGALPWRGEWHLECLPGTHGTPNDFNPSTTAEEEWAGEGASEASELEVLSHAVSEYLVERSLW